MDIMTGLAAAAQALDIAKNLRELEKGFDQAEFKLRIAELYSALSDAKIALADAKEALAAKDAEIGRLKATQGSKMPVVKYRSYSFGIGPDGKSIGRPFCPVCESRGLQIQIVRGSSTQDHCPSCKAIYNSGGYPWYLPDSELPSKSAK